MQTIDLAQLARVTGGAFAQPDAQGAQPGGAAGGGLVGGLDQFLGFLGSQNFQQIVGGLRQILASFGGQPQADGPQTDPSAMAAQQDPQQLA